MGHLGVARLEHLLQVGAFAADIGQALDGFGDRPQLGVFLAEPHDLLSLGGRAHARLDFVEAIEHLIESALGKMHARFEPKTTKWALI